MTSSAVPPGRWNSPVFLRPASDFDEPASAAMHAFLHGPAAMRSHKNFSYFLACLLLACSIVHGPQVHAANASFGVQVRVLGRGAATAPVDVPMPPRSQRMTISREAQSYLYDGESRSAEQFFRATMVERGYRLVSGGDGELMWERNGQHILIRMDAVLGRSESTRIVVSDLGA